MKMLLQVLFLTGALIASVQAQAHSGGTNAAGCHTDHKRGGYHCH
jgi:hypothetical protein